MYGYQIVKAIRDESNRYFDLSEGLPVPGSPQSSRKHGPHPRRLARCGRSVEKVLFAHSRRKEVPPKKRSKNGKHFFYQPVGSHWRKEKKLVPVDVIASYLSAIAAKLSLGKAREDENREGARHTLIGFHSYLRRRNIMTWYHLVIVVTVVILPVSHYPIRQETSRLKFFF